MPDSCFLFFSIWCLPPTNAVPRGWLYKHSEHVIKLIVQFRCPGEVSHCKGNEALGIVCPVDAPSLELLKAMLHGTLGSLIWWGWGRMIFEDPSDPSHSMVPAFELQVWVKQRIELVHKVSLGFKALKLLMSHYTESLGPEGTCGDQSNPLDRSLKATFTNMYEVFPRLDLLIRFQGWKAHFYFLCGAGRVYIIWFGFLLSESFRTHWIKMETSPPAVECTRPQHGCSNPSPF